MTFAYPAGKDEGQKSGCSKLSSRSNYKHSSSFNGLVGKDIEFFWSNEANIIYDFELLIAD